MIGPQEPHIANLMHGERLDQQRVGPLRDALRRSIQEEKRAPGEQASCPTSRAAEEGWMIGGPLPNHQGRSSGPGRHLRETKRLLIYGKEGKSDAVYAFRKFREPHSSTRTYMPLIVPPIVLKDFAKPVFKAIWNKCTDALSTAKRVFFLGYSMPNLDIHAQFIMRCGFHNQTEGKLITDGKRAKATGPAEVIIVNPDRGAAQRMRQWLVRIQGANGYQARSLSGC